MGRQSGGGGCGICRLLNMALTLALLGAGGYVLWYYLGQPSAQDIRDTLGQIDFGDFTDVLDNFTGFDPGFFNEDPYVGDNTTQLWRGHTNGEGGLTLTLQNSLDDNWYSEFDEAVNDWNNCNPKVLELSTTIIEVDHTCTHNDGVMKVCNGNYGDTGWLGINEVMKTVPQKIIQSSTAKMNEYYLNNAGYDERLYTMCHEVRSKITKKENRETLVEEVFGPVVPIRFLIIPSVLAILSEKENCFARIRRSLDHREQSTIQQRKSGSQVTHTINSLIFSLFSIFSFLFFQTDRTWIRPATYRWKFQQPRFGQLFGLHEPSLKCEW